MDLPCRAAYNEECVRPHDRGLTAIDVTELAILHVMVSDRSMPKPFERSSEQPLYCKSLTKDCVAHIANVYDVIIHPAFSKS
jgi:hypothetical protein